MGGGGFIAVDTDGGGFMAFGCLPVVRFDPLSLLSTPLSQRLNAEAKHPVRASVSLFGAADGGLGGSLLHCIDGIGFGTKVTNFDGLVGLSGSGASFEGLLAVPSCKERSLGVLYMPGLAVMLVTCS